MLIKYINKKFSARSLAIISQATEIIDEYEKAGYKLTLRQLYYQFVARALLENTQQSYKQLGSIINDARLAGLISWTAIEDRTRNLQSLSCWESPRSIIEIACQSYRIDKWAHQPFRPEVWIEKEALTGVIAGICESLEVPYFACRGYDSQSEQWAAAYLRFRKYHNEDGQIPIVFHLGDHDPSGIDMTRDNRERLKLLSGFSIEVKRLALNYDQILKHKPPPNYAKPTDSRFRGYHSEYGDQSWELDALEPDLIVSLIREAILEIRDEDKWNETVEREDEERMSLTALLDQFN